MSMLLLACAPPLMMFIVGTGIVVLLPRCRNREIPFDCASAFATASETPTSAFAPRFALLSLPSSSIIFSSTARWSLNVPASRASRITLLILATAFCTPLPRYLALSPSRSSTASRVPVEAPDGTPARPRLPSSRRTSASIVGLPRESRISRARISAILIIYPPIVGARPDGRILGRPDGRFLA